MLRGPSVRHHEAVSSSSDHDPARYHGKNLLLLLSAIGAPAALLYLRLVFAYTSSQGQVTAGQVVWFSWASNIALALFFVVQLIAARYVQRLLKPRTSIPAIALQYVAVLLLCGLLSVVGAVLLEGFGYYLFLRVRTARGPQ